MAKNETGIAITIKAWLPTGKGLDEQYAALSLVKAAHETGDYAPLLAAAKVEAVGTDSKTRRVEEAAPVVPDGDPTPTPEQLAALGLKPYKSGDYTGLADPADANTSPAEPAATDDALAERPDMTEPDGTVTEPAVEAEPKRRAKAA